MFIKIGKYYVYYTKIKYNLNIFKIINEITLPYPALNTSFTNHNHQIKDIRDIIGEWDLFISKSLFNPTFNRVQNNSKRRIII